MVRFGLAADPAQNKVDRWDELNFHRIRVERIFTGCECRAPDTAMTGLNLFAVTKRFASGVISCGAMIRDHHAYIANWNEGFGFYLYCAEPAVDEERAISEYL